MDANLPSSCARHSASGPWLFARPAPRAKRAGSNSERSREGLPSTSHSATWRPVAGREKELIHLLAKVEPAGPIGRERDGAGNFGERLGIEDVAAPRQHRDADASQLRDPRGGGASGIDHDAGADVTLSRADTRHAAVLDDDRGHVDAFLDPGA